MTPDWDAIAQADMPANCGWQGEYRVRYSEIGSNGRATLPALADYMQDAAGWGAKRLSLAYDDTVDRGVAWVLARMVICVRDYPRNGETVRIDTWPSGFSHRLATRDFRLCNDTGRVIAVAQSFWALFDLKARRAARWPDWVMDRLPDPPGPKLMDPAHRPVALPDNMILGDQITARPSDLDVYGHVNNVRLMQWILGVAGTDPKTQNRQADFQPADLDIHFRSECRLHDRVSIRHHDNCFAITRDADCVDLVRATVGKT